MFYQNCNGRRFLSNSNFHNPMFANLQSMFHHTPDANILELDDRFLVEVALPGVVLDDVQLKAEDQYLHIEATRLPAPFEQQSFVHVLEVPYTVIRRSFRFELPIVAEQVEARMDRGILYVSVPKLEIARRIAIAPGSFEGRVGSFATTISNKSESIRSGNKETVVK